MSYAESIEEYKIKRMSRNLKMSGYNDQDQTRFRKRAQTEEEPKSAKLKLEKGGGSRYGKSTCETFGKRHYGECLRGTLSCYVCGKEVHRVRYCHHIASKGKEGKQVTPSVPKEDAPTRRRSYALRSRGLKPDESDDDVDKSYCSCCNLISF